MAAAWPVAAGAVVAVAAAPVAVAAPPVDVAIAALVAAVALVAAGAWLAAGGWVAGGTSAAVPVGGGVGAEQAAIASPATRSTTSSFFKIISANTGSTPSIPPQW